MEIRVTNTCKYLLQTLQNRVQSGPKWGDFGGRDPDLGPKWVQMGPIWVVILDLDPEASSPPSPDAGLCHLGPLRPFGTLRVELSVWPPAGPARDLNMDPEMGPEWVYLTPNWVERGQIWEGSK